MCIFKQRRYNSIYLLLQVNNFEYIAAQDFQSCASKLTDIYYSVVQWTTHPTPIRLFDLTPLEKAIKPNFPNILQTIVTYIKHKKEQIEARVQYTRISAIFRSKQQIKPKEIDIDSSKFRERFEHNKTDYKLLHERIQGMHEKCVEIFNSVEKLFKKQITRLNASFDINKINENIRESVKLLAKYLPKTDTQQLTPQQVDDEKKIFMFIEHIVTGLKEFSDKQSMDVIYSSEEKALEDEITNELIVHRSELAPFYQGIFQIPIETKPIKIRRPVK